MFSKNRPKKRVDLPDNHWVELQYLSKGTKDVLKGATAEIFNKVDSKMFEGDMQDVEFSPNFVQKIQEVEYQKLNCAIHAWSADVEVSIENIKELDDEVYELILGEVDKMNGLSEEEEKN